MRRAENIADYVKRSRYGNFMREEVVAERYKVIENALNKDESVFSAFVGTVYGLPKQFVALTNQRLLIYSLEKKKAKLLSYDLDDIVSISLNDMSKGIIRFETTDDVRDVRAEPCYSKRIALELIDTLDRMRNKKRAD